MMDGRRLLSVYVKAAPTPQAANDGHKMPLICDF
jgi:hypothetical protein